jgi:mannose-6-phosphate isomerase
MSLAPLYPLRFRPILRRLIWGGRRLGTVLHKPIAEGSDYAESWEISDYQDKVSIVAEGELAGRTLRELIWTRRELLLGSRVGPLDEFPLLVKFIDAHDVLSVQVHPDDDAARRLADDNGKTEAWVILDVEPGSVIYAGLKPGVGRDQFQVAIESGAVEPLLHRFEPAPGDCVLIKAGTVHTIGAGVLLAEIQQMSDATFRIYDWGRLGPDGAPRPLHIAAALETINFERGPVNPMKPEVEATEGGGAREHLARSPYFALERLRLKEAALIGRDDRFTILMGLGGSCDVVHGAESIRLDLGTTLLLPAALGPCRIVPRGDAVVLTCAVP